MRKAKLRVLALCLAAALTLAGCGTVDFQGYFRQLGAAFGISQTVAYADMKYTRPDMAALEQTLLDSCDAAANGESFDEVVNGIWAFYQAYDDFYTNYALAYIKYSGDLTDIYWAGEYEYCAENSPAVDAGLDTLYYALAASPFREELEGEDYFGAGFFDGFEGESIWDETFTSMMEQEAALENRYYDLSSQALDAQDADTYYDVYGSQMAQLYAELIALRQQIAAYTGYDSYLDFAYDFYYYRDYTPWQAAEYLEQIRQELVPLYRQLNASESQDLYGGWSSEAETFAYVKTCAGEMGGTVADAFQLLESAGLYDIAYGANKYNSSFEVFLDSYGVPFVFASPQGTDYDKLVFAHEFGHFVNDYACGGSYAGVDVAEVFSQGMEYLSLCYGEDTQRLEQGKMADCLFIYVEQAALASFEQQAYGLTGDDLTAENLYALYAQVGQDFGFDSWGFDYRDFVSVTHFYTDPMYIISYVVSNDAALQLYQMEKAAPGTGLELYQQSLTNENPYFLAFVEETGLESPFAQGRLREVRQTLESILG